MRGKLLIVGMPTTIALLMVAIGLVSRILIDDFDDIELAQTTARAAQVARAFQADLDQLAISTRDYAEWDDAQAYALGKKDDFLTANFSDDSLRGMNVDAVIILAANGVQMYSALLPESGTELISPAPKELLEAFGTLRPAEPALRALPSTRRIMRSSQGLLAFSAVEIRRSDKSGATGAVMFFARFVRADDVQRVGQTSDLPAKLMLLGAPSAALPELPATVQHWLAGSAGESPLAAHLTSADSVTGYALVSDMAGRPVAYFTTQQGRDVGALGRRTTWRLMGTLAALILLSSAALLAMMLRLRRSCAERAAMESRHRNILTHLNESLALADPVSGRIIDANEALLHTLGYTRADLSSLTLRSIYVDLPAALEGGARAAERQLRARDGTLFEEEVTITDLIENQRRLVCLVGRDISQRKRAELALLENQNRLAHVIEHDPLTELPNRRYLDIRLPALLEQTHARNQSLAVLHIGIDRFKNINESGGHGLGNAVLKTIARRLCAATSAHEIVLRTGGDEFVVIVARVTGVELRALAERLLSKLREPVELAEKRMSLTASIGISVYPDDATDAETLIKHADVALHAAKEYGRNCYREFSKDMNADLIEQVALEQALRRALDVGQIHVEYQPVVDLQTGLLVSFEALARPEFGRHLSWPLHSGCREERLDRCPDRAGSSKSRHAAQRLATLRLAAGAGRRERRTRAVRADPIPDLCAGNSTGARSRSALDQLRSDRVSVDAELQQARRHDRLAPARGLPDLHRRLRHRILQSQLSQDPTRGRGQNRSVVYSRHRDGSK